MGAPEESADRRSLILDAAARVVAERGVDRARLADIAEAAGVSLGLVQHYFRHRDRLLVEVFRREQERITATWNEIVDPHAPPLLRLADYLRLCAPVTAEGVTRSSLPGWSFWLEFWSRANRDEQVRAEVAGIYRSFAQHFERAIADGVAQGVFQPRDPIVDVADRVIAQIDGAAIRTLLGVLDERRMLALLIDGLCTDLGVSDEARAQAHERAFRA